MSSNRRSPRANAARSKAKPRPGGRASKTFAAEATGDRLQKVIAAAGVASRRAAEELIEAGRVSVDGKVVRVQGMRVDPSLARIEVDGERINVSRTHEYVLLNKPAGVVTTVRDPEGRRTVLDLVKTHRRLYPVGRLDADTLGLVLLTDHGELTHRLTHPRFQVPRVYSAEVKGHFSKAAGDQLRNGVALDDGVARASKVRVRRSAAAKSLVELTMTEGRKHEVRRMLDEVGYPVIRLVRTAFGPISLGTLASGRSRRLTAEEVGRLLTAAGL